MYFSYGALIDYGSKVYVDMLWFFSCIQTSNFVFDPVPCWCSMRPMWEVAVRPVWEVAEAIQLAYAIWVCIFVSTVHSLVSLI